MADTSISTIITDAFRESNLIAVSGAPTTAEETEALRLLNRFILSLFGGEYGEPLTDLQYGDNNVHSTSYVYDETSNIDSVFLPVNSRLIWNQAEAKTVYLDPLPRAGSRIAIADASNNLATYNLILNGNGRTIEDATSVTLNTSSLSREWFYRDDNADWKRLTDLTTSDTSPFPPEFDDLLSIGLASRLNPRQGVEMDPLSSGRYTELRRKFIARYRQTKQVESEQALLRLPSRKRTFSTGSETNRFERGW